MQENKNCVCSVCGKNYSAEADENGVVCCPVCGTPASGGTPLTEQPAPAPDCPPAAADVSDTGSPEDSSVPPQPDYSAECAAESKRLRAIFLWWILLSCLIPVCCCCAAPGALLIVGAGGAAGGAGIGLAAVAVLVFFGLILIPAAFAHGILIFVLIYRYWKLIPAEFASTTPAKAVGFLLIPCFNLYWGFVAYAGLGRAMNRANRENNSVLNTVPVVLCVLSVISPVLSLARCFGVNASPVLGLVSLLFSLLMCVLFFVMMFSFRNGAGRMLRDTSAPWKRNPPFSMVPVLVGILLMLFVSIAGPVLFLWYSAPQAAFSAFREQFRRIGKKTAHEKCLRDLKQLSLQCLIYASDNGGEFPLPEKAKELFAAAGADVSRGGGRVYLYPGNAAKAKRPSSQPVIVCLEHPGEYCAAYLDGHVKRIDMSPAYGGHMLADFLLQEGILEKKDGKIVFSEQWSDLSPAVMDAIIEEMILPAKKK